MKRNKKKKTNRKNKKNNQAVSMNINDFLLALPRKQQDQVIDNAFERTLKIHSVSEVQTMIGTLPELTFSDRLTDFIDDIRITPYNKTHQLICNNPLYKLGMDVILGKKDFEKVVQLIENGTLMNKANLEHCIELRYYLKTHCMEITDPLIFSFINMQQAEKIEIDISLYAEIVGQFCEVLLCSKKYEEALQYLKPAATITKDIFSYSLFLKNIAFCCNELGKVELLQKVLPVTENLIHCFQKIDKQYAANTHPGTEYETYSNSHKILQTVRNLLGQYLSIESADSDHSYAMQFKDIDQTGKALDLLFEARKAYKMHNESLKIANVNTNIGEIYLQQGKFNRAIKMIKSAETIYNTNNQYDEAVNCKLVRTQAHFLNFEYGKSLKTNIELRKSFQKRNMMIDVAGCDKRIAGCYVNLCKFNKALIAFQNAQKVFEENNMINDTVHCIMGIGEVHMNLNEIEKAIEQFEYARDICRKHNLEYEIIHSMSLLEKVFYLTGQVEKAVDVNQELKKECGKHHDEIGMADCDRRLGAMNIVLGNEDIALKLFLSAKPVLEEHGMCEELTQCTFAIGDIYLHQQKYEQALENFETSKSLMTEHVCRCGLCDNSIWQCDEKIEQIHSILEN